jgi:predicted ArsR family transcriptional regulator
MPRKWTSIKIHEETILHMKGEGKTRQEIADALGLEKLQIKEFIKRHNRQLREGIIAPGRRGRPYKRTPATSEVMALRIKDLEREVALLRSFLHAAGRR